MCFQCAAHEVYTKVNWSKLGSAVIFISMSQIIITPLDWIPWDRVHCIKTHKKAGNVKCASCFPCCYKVVTNFPFVVRQMKPAVRLHWLRPVYAKFIWASPDILSGIPPVHRWTFWILARHFTDVTIWYCKSLATSDLFAGHCPWLTLGGHFVQEIKPWKPGIFKPNWTCPAGPANALVSDSLGEWQGRVLNLHYYYTWVVVCWGRIYSLHSLLQ